MLDFTKSAWFYELSAWFYELRPKIRGDKYDVKGNLDLKEYYQQNRAAIFKKKKEVKNEKRD